MSSMQLLQAAQQSQSSPVWRCSEEPWTCLATLTASSSLQPTEQEAIALIDKCETHFIG